MSLSFPSVCFLPVYMAQASVLRVCHIPSCFNRNPGANFCQCYLFNMDVQTSQQQPLYIKVSYGPDQEDAFTVWPCCPLYSTFQAKVEEMMQSGLHPAPANHRPCGLYLVEVPPYAMQMALAMTGQFGFGGEVQQLTSFISKHTDTSRQGQTWIGAYRVYRLACFLKVNQNDWRRRLAEVTCDLMPDIFDAWYEASGPMEALLEHRELRLTWSERRLLPHLRQHPEEALGATLLCSSMPDVFANMLYVLLHESAAPPAYSLSDPSHPLQADEQVDFPNSTVEFQSELPESSLSATGRTGLGETNPMELREEAAS